MSLEVQGPRGMTTTHEASELFMQVARKLPDSLYSLDGQQQYLMQLADAGIDQDLNDEERAAIEAELERVIAEIVGKIDRTAQMIERFEGWAEDAKDGRKRLAAREKRWQSIADRLREGVFQHLLANGEDHFETPRFTVRLALNPPAVQVVDEHAVPDTYWRPATVPSESDPEARSCGSCGAALVVSKSGVMTHWRATGGKSTPTGVVGGDVPPGVQIERRQSLRIS